MGLRALTVGAYLVSSYPEQNPFEMDPPPYGLTPLSLEFLIASDTPELRAAALAIAEKTGINPFFTMYGYNPIHLWDARLLLKDLPLVDYRSPSPLQEITLPENVEFVEQVNKRGNTPLFTFRADGETRLLKIFPKTDPIPTANFQYPSDPNSKPTVDLERFEQEKEAYAHLKHYGICDQGVVPQCYGWTVLSADHLRSISQVPDITDEARDLYRYDRPVRGIVLEYFPEAERLSQQNVTEKIADNAMRGLYALHSAYVRHCDVDYRNILVLPGERVVWIDFNFAVCPCGGITCRRQELLTELSELWSTLYQQLLPNKRIGYDPATYAVPQA